MTRQGKGRERNSIAFFCSLAWFGSSVKAQCPDRPGWKDFWGVSLRSTCGRQERLLVIQLVGARVEERVCGQPTESRPAADAPDDWPGLANKKERPWLAR